MAVDGDDVAGMAAGSCEVVGAGSVAVEGGEVVGGSVVVDDVAEGGAPVVGLVGGAAVAFGVCAGPGEPALVAPVEPGGAVVPGEGDAQPAGICAEGDATMPAGVLEPPRSPLSRREAPGRSPRRRDPGVRSQFTPSTADCPV